jgi:hypothetical protein
MQFIEKNSLNVRSAVYLLKKDGTGLEFLVFPMIHVGSREFYQDVSRMLSGCDLVLAEGVKSKKVNVLTLSYSIVSRIRRMDLITQHEGMKDGFRDKTVIADMEGSAFDDRWSSLPIMLRLQLFFLVPVFATYLFLFGTRETIAESLALEDLPSNEEVLSKDENSDLDRLLIDERDQKLLEQITNVHEKRSEKSWRVGIVFGALHIRSVIAFLIQKLNYRVAKAEWLKVFDL